MADDRRQGYLALDKSLLNTPPSLGLGTRPLSDGVLVNTSAVCYIFMKKFSSVRYVVKLRWESAMVTA